MDHANVPNCQLSSLDVKTLSKKILKCVHFFKYKNNWKKTILDFFLIPFSKKSMEVFENFFFKWWFGLFELVKIIKKNSAFYYWLFCCWIFGVKNINFTNVIHLFGRIFGVFWPFFWIFFLSQTFWKNKMFRN